METIATIFDKETEMEKELKELDEKMDQVKGKVEKQNDEALIIMANEGKISAYGPGSRYGGIIYDVAGYKAVDRLEEHTSELQSRGHLVCRLLLEKKTYYYGDFDRSKAT